MSRPLAVPDSVKLKYIQQSHSPPAVNTNLQSVEEVRSQFTEELNNLINESTWGKKRTEHPFPYKLWKCLQWTGNDKMKMENLGIGWVNDTEFWIEKQRFCNVIKMQLNTFNFKLRTCKFMQSRQRQNTKTYWKCDGFSQNSTIEDLTKIDMRRSLDDNLPQVTELAIYLPLLDSIGLFTSGAQNLTLKFKSDAILLWADIIRNNTVWAVSSQDFLNAATQKFCDSFTGNSDAFSYDTQQTEFGQYIKLNHMDLFQTARQMINYVLIHPNPNLITLIDFCKFLARFGPEQCILEKIHQLLICSHTFADWFQPQEQVFDQNKMISGCFSNTFANAFVIKRMQGITMHLYNLPNANIRIGFLVDETCKKYLTWHSAFDTFNVTQAPPTQIPYNSNNFLFNDQLPFDNI